MVDDNPAELFQAFGDTIVGLCHAYQARYPPFTPSIILTMVIADWGHYMMKSGNPGNNEGDQEKLKRLTADPAKYFYEAAEDLASRIGMTDEYRRTMKGMGAVG